MIKSQTWREWLQLLCKGREGSARRSRRRRTRSRVPEWCQQPGWPLITWTKVVGFWPPPPCPPPACPWWGPKPPWLMCQGLRACWLIRKCFTSGKVLLNFLHKDWSDNLRAQCDKSSWLTLGDTSKLVNLASLNHIDHLTMKSNDTKVQLLMG